MTIYVRLKNLPVHRSMREISELIYETCKTYLVNQGKFLFLLWIFIAAVIVLYFGVLRHYEAGRVGMILFFSVVGILGSYGVAWFGIRVNTFANSRTAFAGLAGKPYPIYQIPLRAGMSIGMMLISVELLMMLIILLFVPGDYAGPCFIGFAIGESLGAAALRIAGGIFTKIADIGADLMKIVFKIKEDDARNPGVIADCTGDNAGDSVGPSADGFETYGVTGVALITFILLGVAKPRRAGPVAGMAFRNAHRHAGGQRGRILHQHGHRQSARFGNADEDELRIAAHFAGLDHFDRFHRNDVCHLPRSFPTLAATPRSGGS
jgi:K(+)-stimulated pyrophosphate-energized sodium pump